MYDDLPTPAVVAELDPIEANIRTMVAANARYGLKVRPHIKPHKSVFLTRLELELGCQGITCAKLGEAEVMAAAGFTDILIAFPLIGEDKMTRLARLTDQAQILTIVNSVAGARQLAQTGQSTGRPIRTLIELDGGIRRGGIQPLAPAVAFARAIHDLQGLQIVGLMYYGGTIYNEDSLEGFERVARLEQQAVTATARLLSDEGLDMGILSGGNSFAAKMPHCLAGLTEVRPGNFIFNDCNQLFAGMATEAQCSLRVVATVVCLVDSCHAIIDAGSKTLTTDLCAKHPGYGAVVGRPDICLTKLNEEHGFIESRQPLGLEIGDKIAIIPNHACVVPNLADEIYGIRNNQVERLIRIEARGMNR
ncbi:MAG TPA: amino acid processing protein [Clostridiales bacterium]|nr:amino acid processing protein [Clostridiales bacterium]